MIIDVSTSCNPPPAADGPVIETNKLQDLLATAKVSKKFPVFSPSE